jgi:hypothetical protein
LSYSDELPALSREDLLNILEKFDFSILSKNDHYISLKSDNLGHEYDDLVITLPNRDIMAGQIIDSALKQGRISRKNFIEELKEIFSISGKESLVAHVDILGFKSMILDAQTNESKFDELLNHYNKALKPAFFWVRSATEAERQGDLGRISHVRVYTDNILFVRELGLKDSGEVAFGRTLDDIARYQLSLALEGYFSRGGIVVERSYCDEVLVFSPALLSADKIEQKAKYPRIILCDSALDKVNLFLHWYADPHSCPFNDILCVDQDGTWFINYLYILRWFNDDMMQLIEDGFLEQSDLKGPYHPDAIEPLHQHRDLIIQNLKKFKGGSDILQKYLWLAKYHNYFCTQYFPEEDSAVIEEIDLDLPFRSPWSAVRE